MKRISVILGLLMVCLAGLYSQNKWNNYSPNTTEGTEFYLTFLGTNSQIGTNFNLDLFIAAKKPTTVTVTTLTNGQSLSVSVTKDTVLHITNPSDVYLNTPDLTNQNVMKVTSTQPIALYMATSEARSGDASLVLPTYALGQEYVVQSYMSEENVTEFAVIATSPGWTNITIDPTQITVENSGGARTQRAAHVPVVKSLYQGEVYYMTTFSQDDISGTTICADKNIAVFNGNQNGYTSSSTSFMCHQSIPVRMWGKKYVAVVAAKQIYNFVRVTAADSATIVKMNGVAVDTLMPFETSFPLVVDSSTTSSCYIETTKPTICYQYMSSSDEGGAYMGSPATMLLTPLEEAVNAIRVSNFKGYIVPKAGGPGSAAVLPWSYYVNLVVPTASVGNMVMDNMPLTTGFQPVTGLSGYSYRKVPVTAGSHEFTNSSGKFIATVYQESNAHSYAYNAGLNTMNLDAYMLLNGNRVSRVSVCKDSANSWSGNFQAVVNGPYNSIKWYDEYEGNWRFMSSSSSFHYNFQDSDLHHIYMVVNRPSLVCNNVRNDTVWADFVCAMTYNKSHQTTYACKGDTVRFYENDSSPLVLWTDTMKAYKEYQYKRRYESSLGCDSVVIEKLQILNPQRQVINKEICEGESYRFGDKNYRYGDTIITTTGRYTQTWYELDLCPYEVELNLKVNPVYFIPETVIHCKNTGTFVWKGHKDPTDSTGTKDIRCLKSGVYYDSLKTKKGCDSIHQLTFQLVPNYHIIDTVRICDNELPYVWRERNLTKSGTYHDSLKTFYDCDSVFELTLIVNPTFYHHDTIQINDKGQFSWQGKVYYGRDYSVGWHDTLKSYNTVNGCDSIYYLRFKVDSTYMRISTHEMCENESYVWRGKTISNKKADTYQIYDSLKSVLGYDSIMRLDLTVYPTYNEDYIDTICQGMSYIPGRNIQLQDWKKDIVGVHDTTIYYKTSHGCDSTVNYKVYVRPVYNNDTTINICTNGSCVWQGQTFSNMEAGTYDYYDNHKTNAGCDSNFHLRLNVLDTIVNTTIHQMSDQEHFTWQGIVLRGTKYNGQADSVLNVGHYVMNKYFSSVASHCDSIERLVIDVYETYIDEINGEVCQYEYYTNGDIHVKHDTAGEYSHTFRLKTAHQYDSIVNLQLTVNPVYNHYDTAYVCKNNLPYVWHRGPGDANPVELTEDTETGSYPHSHTYKTNKGCDSTYHLLLHVMDTIVVTMDTTICDIEKFVWDGRTYGGNKTTGVDSTLEVGYWEVMHRYVSERIQCDSVMRLRVRVNQTYAPVLYDSVCQSSDYQFGKHTLNHDETGEYVHVDSLLTANGCDSIVTLHLRVDPIYNHYDTAYVCKNNLPYVWHRGPGDENPVELTEDTETGSYPHSHTYKTNKGCDSTYHLLLHVMDTIVVTMDTTICDIEKFVWDGRTYGGNKAEGVDSTLKLGYSEYMHRYVSERIQCDSVMRLRVRVNQTYAPVLYDSVCQSSDYQFGKHTLNHDETGEYVHVDSLLTANGCDSIVTLHLRVDPIYNHYDTAYVCKNNLPYVWHRGPGDANPVELTEDTETGSYPHSYTYKTNKGCDSTYHLLLHVMDTIVVTMDTTICDIEKFVWDGRTYGGNKAEGVDSTLKLGYSEVMHRYVSERIQCDSVMRLRVRVNPTYRNVHFDTICQYETKQFSTLPLFTGDNEGDYTLVDSLSSKYSCDSVEILQLRVNPVYFIPETFEICENGSYNWHGREFSGLTSGSYEYWDSLKTKAGCDSIYKLSLRVIETYEFPTVRTMCENDSVHWRSHYYFGDKFSIGGLAPGVYTYTDSFKTKSLCDSVYKLTLYVNRVDFTDLGIDSACKGDVYPLCTKKYLCDYPGTYDFRDTLKNMYGCDSVVKVTVKVYPTYCFETQASICENGTYQWRGHSFSNLTVGTHVTEDKYVSSHGCDSIYKLTLTVISTYFYQTPYSMCDYDTMTWRGIKIGPLHADSYVFWDSLKTQAGCDSVYKLNLVVHPSFYVHESMDMCDNETIPYLTHTLIYPPGKYILIDTLDSHYGCDSIVEMTVYVHPTYYFEENETICSNETYTWHGQTYRVSGTYYDRQKTQTWNCDSIYQLNLYVQPAYKFESYRTICDNESIEFQGVTLRDPGSHTFHYVTVNGCDSDYVIYLTVNKSSFENRYVTICDYETYSFAGKTLNKTGVYHDSLRTSKGCDSVITLHLTVNPSYRFVTYRENMCNDTVMFRGKSYSKAGTYYDSLKTQGGCDSVYVLVRTDLPSYVFETDTTLCDCYQLKWRGKTYLQSGTFYDSLKTRAGCDSIYVLNLKYEPTSFDSIYKEICFGESYTVHGNSYSVSGVYYDTLSAIKNFDCNVTKLTLSVIMPTEFIKMSVPDICADDSLFIIDHAYKGEKPITYSVYFDDAAINEGFQNQINKPYDGKIEALVPKFDRQDKYVRPDYYGVTVSLDNGVCDPEGYQKEEKMLVRWPSWITEQRWQDVVAVVNDKYNGGYTFSRFDWYVNSQYMPNDRESYIYMYEKLFIGDEVYVKLTRDGESYSIPSCPIIIEDRRAMQGHDLPIIVQLPGDMSSNIAKVKSEVDAYYSVSDFTGKILENGEIIRNVETIIEFPYVAGVYLVRFYSKDGRNKVMKVIIK